MAGTHAGFPSQIKGGQHAQLREACPQRIEQAARVAHQAAQSRQAGHCHSGVCWQLLAAEGQLVELREAQQRLHRGQRQAALALELHPSQRPGCSRCSRSARRQPPELLRVPISSILSALRTATAPTRCPTRAII